MNPNILFIDSPSFGKLDMIEAMEKRGFLLDYYYHEDIFTYPKTKKFTEDIELFLTGKDFLFVFSFNYFPAISDICNARKIPYLAYVYDNPLKSLYSCTMVNPVNHVFLFDKVTYNHLKKIGLSTIYYLPLCANTERLSAKILSKDKVKIFESDVSFVGSLYDEKHNFLDRMTDLDDFTKGYLDGIMEAQLKINGYFFIEDVLTPEIITSMKKSLNYEPDKYGIETESYIYANYFIARKITALERFRLLKAVSERFNTKLYTHNPTPQLPLVNNMGAVDYYDTMPFVFKNSKINLNITLRSIQSGIPLRCFDVMGAGGFLLSNYQADFFDFFHPQEDFDFYDGEEDLLHKTEYYLSHPKEREEIARNGFQKVKEFHNYSDRLALMLEAVGIT